MCAVTSTETIIFTKSTVRCSTLRVAELHDFSSRS